MFGVRYDPEAEDISTIAWNGKRKREEDLDSSDIGSDNLGEQNDTKELSKGKENHDIDHEDSTNRIDTTEEVGFSNGVEGDSDVEMEDNIDPVYPSKHQSVLNKFKQSITSAEQHYESDSDEKETIVDIQDLAPLPQPQLPRDKKLTSTSQYSKNLDWLTTPQYVTPNEKLPFQEFELDKVIQRNISSLGFSEAFAVQVSVLKMMIPEIKANKRQPDAFGDILVNASTGSGKTLAYCIPIIQAIHNRVVPRVRAIVLVPTKPLINQVKTTMMQLSQGTNLSIVGLKNDISIKEESERLKKLVPDVIISTPGRLVELLYL